MVEIDYIVIWIDFQSNKLKGQNKQTNQTLTKENSLLPLCRSFTIMRLQCVSACVYLYLSMCVCVFCAAPWYTLDIR